jgi:hypothetical protein
MGERRGKEGGCEIGKDWKLLGKGECGKESGGK